MHFISNLDFQYRICILFLIAFISTMIVYKPILRIALKKNIVDNPDVRKLQKAPVPVMGGIAVFFGMVVGLCFFKTLFTYNTLFPLLGSMVIMLYLGCMDDILSIRPGTRFLIEIMVAGTMIFGFKLYICNFQGMWGIGYLDVYTGVALSILTFLGVVNAINMIDGVDGLSSAFCILILGCFGILCFISHIYSLAGLAAVSIGALLPFFLHNVFGKTTKMFIGDGGTMMMGTAISAMIFAILSNKFVIDEKFGIDNFSCIAFVLAVMSIPVADTLRVMFCRMAHKKSPFKPDKTHLHHLFVSSGFSHIAVTIIEISLDILVIASFFLSWKLGASLQMQLYVVIAIAALFDFGIAALLLSAARKGDGFYRKIESFGAYSHVERRGIWLKIQNLVDNKFEK